MTLQGILALRYGALCLHSIIVNKNIKFKSYILVTYSNYNLIKIEISIC
jgi:hypothetical protein